MARPPTPSQLYMPGLAALRGTTRGSPRLRATGSSWLPSALRGSHPAQAAPRGSSPSPALPTVRVRHARALVHAPATCHVAIPSQTVPHGMPVVDSTACHPPGAPGLSTTPVAQARARVPAPLHALACAAVIVRASKGVRQACWQTSWSTGCVPTGDRGAYLRETPRVPTGDAPRTYGRRFSMQASTKQSVMRPRL
jgi:hypothetical protein